MQYLKTMIKTRKEIKSMFEKLLEAYELLKKEDDPAIETIVKAAASAENLAEHAAQNDMSFTATCLLTMASRLNRLLSIKMMKMAVR